MGRGERVRGDDQRDRARDRTPRQDAVPGPPRPAARDRGATREHEPGDRHPRHDQPADEKVEQRCLDAERRYQPAGGDARHDHECVREQRQQDVQRRVREHHEPAPEAGPADERDADDVGHREEQRRRPEPRDIPVHAGRIARDRDRDGAHRRGIELRQRGPAQADEDEPERGADGEERPGPGPVPRRRDGPRDQDDRPAVAGVLGAAGALRQDAGGDERRLQRQRSPEQQNIHEMASWRISRG